MTNTSPPDTRSDTELIARLNNMAQIYTDLADNPFLGDLLYKAAARLAEQDKRIEELETEMRRLRTIEGANIG